MSTRPPEHPPGWKNIQQKQTYPYLYVCGNCGHRQKVSIPIGKPALVIAPEPCEICGRYQLKKG